MNCWKTFYGGDGPFLPSGVFLVAQGISWVGKGTDYAGAGVGDCMRLPSSECSTPLCLCSTCFSFDFITLHQFDPISCPFYSPNISNQ